MGNRRFAQVSTSDEEDEVPAPKPQSSNSDDSLPTRRKRKKMKLDDDEEEDEGDNKSYKKNKKIIMEEEREGSKQQGGEEDEDDQPQEDAKPIGDPVRVSGKGRGRKSHYNAFEYDGNRYDLMSSVRFLILHGGEWNESETEYNGGRLKGMVAESDITYKELVHKINEVTNIDFSEFEMDVNCVRHLRHLRH